MKKKLILAMLACLLVLICTACGSSNTESATEATGVSPDFKAAMDSYEEFFGEYVEFMKKYKDADSTNQAAMMSDFADYMTKYTETMQKMDDIDQDSLSEADLAYYTEVNARIVEKLSEVS